jgi:hypothetical protein
MRGVELANVDIHGEIMNVTVNGVDIGPLVNAELDRRYPDRAKMRPADPAAFREAWDILERLWGQSVDRARRLPPELLHESRRRMVIHPDVASSGVRDRCVDPAGILGDPTPWDPLDLPWDEMQDTPGVPRDRDARPSLEVVLDLRRDRMATVRQVIEGLTAASLDSRTEPAEGPGWPPPRSFPIRECLLVVLNEEWQHRLYAERDLQVLEARGRAGQDPDGPWKCRFHSAG